MPGGASARLEGHQPGACPGRFLLLEQGINANRTGKIFGRAFCRGPRSGAINGGHDDLLTEAEL
jgi:hypothetical protein